MSITIVTSFYIIPENQKRSIGDYLSWIPNFLKYVRHPIVFFSDGEIADLIDSFRKKIHPTIPWKMIKKPLKDLDFQGDEWENYWIECCIHMPHIRVNSPNVYRIWANKITFLDEVRRENPFNTSHFYWCDAGSWRNEEFSAVMGYQWKLPLGPKFHIAWIDNYGVFKNADEILEKDRATIAGGIYGGSAELIPLVKERFYKMYERAKHEKILDVIDQNIMAAATIDMPDVVHWNSKIYTPILEGDPWFLFQYLFFVEPNIP